MNQDGLARLKLGVVEQHVLDRRKRDGRASGMAKGDAFRHPDYEAGREIEEIASKAIDVEAENAADVFAEIVAAFATGPALSAGERAIHRDAVADAKTGNIGPNRRDFARGFRADHQRQPAFRERHAAPAPHIDVVERHPPDPNLHLACARSGRLRRLLQLELAIGNEGQRSHGCESPQAVKQDDREVRAVTTAPAPGPARRSGPRIRKNWTARDGRPHRVRRSVPRRAGSPGRALCN